MLSRIFRLFKRNKKTDSTTDCTTDCKNKKFDFPIDFSRIDDIDYLTQEDVLKFLESEIVDVMETIFEYHPSDYDENHFNKERLKLQFGEYIRVNGSNKSLLREFITGLLYRVDFNKLYYVKTCVICLENDSYKLFKCNHVVTCRKCYIITMKTSKRCPMCRSYVGI